MNVDVYKLVKITKITSGRRILAMRLVEKIARGMGLTALVAHLERAIAHDRETRALDSRWAGYQRTRYAGKMGALDRAADHMLSSVRDIAIAQVSGTSDDDPLRAQADAMLAAVFPHGVGAITSLPYPEQAAVMENIGVVLTGAQAEAVEALGLTRTVGRLVALTARYRAKLEEVGEPLTFSTVRAMRRRGQALMLQAVFLILGEFSDPDEPAHIAARDALLEPIMEQDRAVRAYLRARRRVRDVDPDTGQEDPAPVSEGADDEADAA